MHNTPVNLVCAGHDPVVSQSSCGAPITTPANGPAIPLRLKWAMEVAKKDVIIGPSRWCDSDNVLILARDYSPAELEIEWGPAWALHKNAADDEQGNRRLHCRVATKNGVT